jgi:hypothetical protein
MCGNKDAAHDTSVDDMISAIVAPPTPPTAAAVDTDNNQRQVRFTPSVEVRQTRQVHSAPSTIKTSVAPPRSMMSSNTSSPMEDDIEVTATMFETKEDGKKTHQQIKGGRRDKVLSITYQDLTDSLT